MCLMFQWQCFMFNFVVEANSGVTVIRWFDNGLVQLLSNYVGNYLAAQARRWSRKEGCSSTSIGQQWLLSTTATWVLSTCVTCWCQCIASYTVLQSITCTWYSNASARLLWMVGFCITNTWPRKMFHARTTCPCWCFTLKLLLVFVRLGNHQVHLQGHVVDHLQRPLFLLLHHQGKGK